MSHLGSSSAVAGRLDDEGRDAVDGSQRKRLKLDLGTQLLECEVPASKVKIENLPDELLAMILQYYSFTELIEIGQNVCTQWRRASQDPLLWQNGEYYIKRKVTDAKVLATLPRMPQLRNLIIERHVKAAVIQAIRKHCKQLTYLNMVKLKRKSRGVLKKLVNSCKNIKILEISAELLQDEITADVLSGMNLLSSLRMLGRTNKTIHLAPLAKGCPELSKLKLVRVSHICTEDLSQLIEAKCKTLNHLELPWAANDGRCLVPLLMSCTALVKLELYNAPNSIGELMQTFSSLRHLPNLRSLRLHFFNEDVPAQAFKSAVLLHLEMLRIENIYTENSVLIAISECCPNLKELHLARCFEDDEGDFMELHRFKKLETLSLINCDDLQHESLRRLCQVPSLRKLLFEDCDFSYLKPALNSILDINSLEILSFTNVKYMCYFPFKRIPEMLTNLRILNVVESKLDKRILEQLNQMPGLQVYVSSNVDKNYLRKMERIMKL